MSETLIGMLAAISAFAWTYSKVSRRTGGSSNKNSIIVAAIAAIMAFIAVLTLLKIAGNYLS